jgi:BirA family transcriptional regulator, biotin operon repressor / biotin---[acetyl-CoA-carboxylase] ligase
VAGILLESEGEAGGSLAVAIGIGVNCAHHPDVTSYPATDLASAGVPTAPERLFVALSRAMSQRLTQWDRARGFAAIRTDWLARAAGVGDAIRVALAERELEGRFEALDSAGHLVLRLGDGSVTSIPAGDVFPLPASTAATPGRTSA